MVTLKGSKYVNKMDSNDKGQSPNFKSISNAKKYVTAQVQSSMVHGSRLIDEGAQWEKGK